MVKPCTGKVLYFHPAQYVWLYWYFRKFCMLSENLQGQYLFHANILMSYNGENTGNSDLSLVDYFRSVMLNRIFLRIIVIIAEAKHHLGRKLKYRKQVMSF